MRCSLLRNLFLVGLLATTIACGDDNDSAAAPNNPADAPAPTDNPINIPVEEQTPGAFEWASTRFEEDVEECEGIWRFTINANGAFTSTTCNAEQNKSGNISTSDLARVDEALARISQAEASSSSSCTSIENNAGLKDQKVSMATQSNQRYTLYTRAESRECFRGTASEVSSLRDLLYELRSIYVNSY